MHAFLPKLLSLEIIVGGLYVLSVYNFFQIRAMIRTRKTNHEQMTNSRSRSADFIAA